MRHFMRSIGVAVLTVLATMLLVLTQSMTSNVVLAATALIMGGTGHPLSVPPDTQDFVNGYVAAADSNYIGPSGLCAGGSPGCTLVAVVTPEQFFPVHGTLTFNQSVAAGLANLDSCLHAGPCTLTRVPPNGTGTTTTTVADTKFVVYGYSESATIATLEKRKLIGEPNPPQTNFVLIANPNRPNGGILERFNGAYIPILDVSFNGATPTNSSPTAPFTTVDVARQYDGFADTPTNPLNLLADANAVAGAYYLHGNYTGPGLANSAQLQGQYQDTTYYLIPTTRLPILMPLAQLGVPDPVLAVIDAPLRVLVETGYDRTINPGQPTPANFLYFPNPIQTAANLVIAIPTGLDDGAQEAFGVRPLGTTPANDTYGVGGPPVNAGSVDPYGPPTPLPTTMMAAPMSTASPSTVAPISTASPTTAANATPQQPQTPPQPAATASVASPTSDTAVPTPKTGPPLTAAAVPSPKRIAPPIYDVPTAHVNSAHTSAVAGDTGAAKLTPRKDSASTSR